MCKSFRLAVLVFVVLLVQNCAESSKAKCKGKPPPRRTTRRHPPPRIIGGGLPPPPPPASDVYKTLQRTYTDRNGVNRTGWVVENQNYTDGNIYQAAMILNSVKWAEHNMTEAEVEECSKNSTAVLTPHGAEGQVVWFKNTWDRADNGTAYLRNDTSGARTGRAMVFRTNTDVFVWIPGTDVGEVKFDLPSDPTDLLDLLKSGGFGLGTGDWATNFEFTQSPILAPTGLPILVGYYDMFQTAIKNQLTTLINEKLQELQPGWQPGQNTSARVFIIGHSQGGAMAAISSVYFFASGYPWGGAYLFADPSAQGDEEQSMPAFFKSNNMWNKTFRIINGNDPVPQLPPGSFHPGRTFMMCDNELYAYDDWGRGSPFCNGTIGGIQAPSGSGLAYIESLARLVSQAKNIIDNFSNLMTLHTAAFYANSVLRVLSPSTDPRLQSILSPYAWTRGWVTSFCVETSDCQTGCGNTTSAATCGPSWSCGITYLCNVGPSVAPPPPPLPPSPPNPPPCTIIFGIPCIG